MNSHKTEIDLEALKSILDKLNEPEYVVYCSQHLSEDTIKMLKENNCEYQYLEPIILGEPEDCFYVLSKKMLNDYCYKLEDLI